jgi:putative transposase
MSAVKVRQAYRFVSFTVEVDRAAPAARARPGSVIGVDLGVKVLLTGVDDAGNVVTVVGAKALASSLRKLRRASRAHSRKERGSANRRRHADRLARVHARVTNVRIDALHKATTMLARRYETLVAEDLNVGGMTRNRRLARFYPSSKTCSACGWRKPSLALAERTFACEACGFVLDRDQNAARNLLRLAASGAESENAWGGTVRPSPAERVPVNQEPGTAHAGKTGTVPGQRGTAA